MYERVVAMGGELCKTSYFNPEGRDDTAPKPPLRGRRRISVRDWTERALRHKALACQGSGDAAEGLRTILYLRAWAPNSQFILELVPLEVQFRGDPPEEATTAVQAEREASQLCHQAHEAFWQSCHDEALPLLDRVISSYPQTAAALRAKVDKARILWGRSQFEAARELFQGILDEFGPIAPDSDYVLIARHHVAWAEMASVMKASMLQVRAGQLVPHDQWEQARAACRVVMELYPDPTLRADANAVLVEAYCWEGLHEDVLREANYFFRRHCGASEVKNRRFAGQIAWVHLFAGDALEHLSRPTEAAAHYQAILTWNADHPETMGGREKEMVVQRASLRLTRVTE